MRLPIDEGLQHAALFDATSANEIAPDRIVRWLDRREFPRVGTACLATSPIRRRSNAGRTPTGPGRNSNRPTTRSDAITPGVHYGNGKLNIPHTSLAPMEAIPGRMVHARPWRSRMTRPV